MGNGFSEACMEQQEAENREQIEDANNVRLQCTVVRIRNMDTGRGRQKEAAGIRNEMLPADSKNQLERHDSKRRHQEKETRTIRSYLQNR